MLQMTIRRPPACANRLRIASGPTSWCHAPGGCSRAGALFPFRSLYATARTRAIAALASSAAYKGSAGRGFGQQTPGGRRRRAARFPNSAPRAVGFYHGSLSGVRNGNALGPSGREGASDAGCTRPGAFGSGIRAARSSRIASVRCRGGSLVRLSDPPTRSQTSRSRACLAACARRVR